MNDLAICIIPCEIYHGAFTGVYERGQVVNAGILREDDIHFQALLQYEVDTTIDLTEAEATQPKPVKKRGKKWQS